MTRTSRREGGEVRLATLRTAVTPEEALRLVDLARTLATSTAQADVVSDVRPMLDDAAKGSQGFLDVAHDLVSSVHAHAAVQERLAARERDRARRLTAVLHAQEEERDRIARDLQDQVGQSLTALLLGLETACTDGVQAERECWKGLVTQALEDVSRLASALRPSLLDALGLEVALTRHARDLTVRAGIRVEVAVALPRLSRQVETALYRVAQEALGNVARHAKAHAASVVVTATPDQVDLVVEDDGIGFDEGRLAAPARLGLDGMRERVERLGGVLHIESAHGLGAAVYARIPRRDS